MSPPARLRRFPSTTGASPSVSRLNKPSELTGAVARRIVLGQMRDQSSVVPQPKMSRRGWYQRRECELSGGDFRSFPDRSTNRMLGETRTYVVRHTGGPRG